MAVSRRINILTAAFALTSVSVAVAEDAGMATDMASRQPAWLLEIPDSVTDILIADAGSATMHRFARAGEDIVEIDQRYMSIGQNGPGKEKAWDGRTPLGIYFITESLDTSRLHDKYGVAAFPLDYPNAWDRHNSRTGYGIWLHGVDHNNPERPPLDTDGCLSLPNEEIQKLVDRLQPLVTPIVVAREMRWAMPGEVDELRLEFRLALDMWRHSLEQGDILAYLSLYADDFRYRDMDRGEWNSYRLSVFESRQLDRVELEDIMLLADPEVPDLYLSRFTQILATVDGPVTTTKRLYWRRSNGNQWKIVSEDSG
jgi:murein L,D-transpeptidase YafK